MSYIKSMIKQYKRHKARGTDLNSAKLLEQAETVRHLLGKTHQKDFELIRLALFEEMVTAEDIETFFNKYQATEKTISFINFLIENEVLSQETHKSLKKMYLSVSTEHPSCFFEKDTFVSKRRKRKHGSETTRSSTASTGNKTKIEDSILQQLLLSLEIINMVQLSECISIQVDLQLQGQFKPLSEIVIEEGYLTEQYIDNLKYFRDEDGESIIVDYEIIDIIGEGGLAIVYLGRSVHDNQSVAIKVFAPGNSDTSSTIARFMREAEAAKKLDHPNIVKANDFGSIHGIYYLVMENISGLSLSQIISRMGRLEEQKALAILEQIAGALTYAWQNGIIHRDIKPGNILSDGDIMKICDLGLAKAIDAGTDLTQEGSIVGTPQYMSPEQFQPEKKIDYRTDIYSLGVTFYVMLTGKLPFGVSTKIGLAQAHIAQEPQDLEKHNVHVSKPTRALLYKMMSKDREKRAQSQTELIEDIQNVLEGKFPKNTPSSLGKGFAGKIIMIAFFLLIVLSGVFSFKFFIKPSKPIRLLSITPHSQNVIFTEKVHISGTFFCTDLDYVTINDQQASISRKNNILKFSIMLPLKLGKNDLQILIASRDTRKKIFQYRLVRKILDRTPPKIVLLSQKGYTKRKEMFFSKIL